MSFYTGLANVASSRLLSKGQSVTFTRTTGATSNLGTGDFSGGSPTTFSGNGAAFDYLESEIDGEVIQRGDIRLILEATTTAPEQDDKCTVDSIDYRVMSVSPLSPAGTAVIYTVQLRR